MGGGQRSALQPPLPVSPQLLDAYTHHKRHLHTHATNNSSSAAIAILYKSHLVKALEEAVDALWDVADQVGAGAAGAGRALRASLQVASDLACDRFQQAAPAAGQLASPQGLASQGGGGGPATSTGRTVVAPALLPMLHLVLGLDEQ